MTLIFGYICSSSLAQSTETNSYYQSPLDPSTPFISLRRVNAFCFGTISVNQESLSQLCSTAAKSQPNIMGLT